MLDRAPLRLLFASLATGPALAQLPATLDLANPVGFEDLRVVAGLADRLAGAAVRTVPDLNGDGYADLVVGAHESNRAASKGGACAVLWGGPWTREAGTVDLDDLDGTRGFLMVGSALLGRLGHQVSGLGDVNGDGWNDFGVSSEGHPLAAGDSYVVFGGPDLGAGGTLDLSALDGTDGFRVLLPPDLVQGSPRLDGVGDFYGDGHGDFVVGFTRSGEYREMSTIFGSPFAVATGDLNGDGWDDVVVGHSGSGQVSTHQSLGDGTFVFQQQVTGVGEVHHVELHDLDQDGDPDLIATSLSGELHVSLNPGNGNFLPVDQVLPMTHTFAPIAVGDFDADGDPDLVLASWVQNMGTWTGDAELEVYLNDGLGSFSVGPKLSVPGAVRELQLGDLDGDGYADVVCGVDASPDHVLVVRNDGTGGFGVVSTHAIAGSLVGVQVADLDQDGDLDVLPTGCLLRGDGAGNLAPFEPLGANVGFAIDLADVDGDGDLDLFGVQSDSCLVALNPGDGLFGVPQDHDLIENVHDGATLDWDGDGVLDVVCLPSQNARGLLLPGLGGGRLDGVFRGAVFVVNGGPSTGASGVLDLAGLSGPDGFRCDGAHGGARLGSAAIGLGDHDGDGLDDLALASSGLQGTEGQAGGAYVLLGGSAFGSTGEGDLEALTPAQGYRAVGGSGGNGVGGSLAAGDLDGDGLGDLVLGAPDRSSDSFSSVGGVYVVLGHSTPVAGGTLDLATLDGTNGLAFEFDAYEARLGEGLSTGDLDQDGRDDLLIGAPGVDGRRGRAFLWYGATFPQAPLVDLTLGTAVVGHVVLGANADEWMGECVSLDGDVDGDGSVDLVLGAPYSDHAAVPGEGEVHVLFGPDTPCGAWLGAESCTSEPNSTGVTAALYALGSDVVADNCLELRALDLPTGQFGYLLASLTQATVPQPGGAVGTLCLGGTIGRFIAQVQNSGPAGAMQVGVDLTQLPFPLPSNVQPGETWTFQLWYRDLDPGTTSNFSRALEIAFQ